MDEKQFKAESFLRLAENFLKSSIVLLENIENIRPAPYASIFFCACHSIELSLKALLIYNNKDEKFLKKMGHDLCMICEEARILGLDIDANDMEYIDLLNEYFSKQEFRYPNMKVMTLPNADQAIKTADFILDDVYLIITGNKRND